MHLLTSAPKSLLLSKQNSDENEKSIVKKQNCEKCRKKAFVNLAEVQLHFKNSHHLNVMIKDIIVDDKEENEPEVIEFDQADNFKCNFCPIENSETFESDELRIKHINEVHATTNETQFQVEKLLHKTL